MRRISFPLAAAFILGLCLSVGSYALHVESAHAAGNPVQPLPIAESAVVSGGASTFFNDAVTTATQVKATRGQVYVLSLTNTTAAAAYLQVFCAPSASVTLGTTAPDFAMRLLASATRDVAISSGVCGAGSGITVAGTTTPTGSTTAAVSVMAAFK